MPPASPLARGPRWLVALALLGAVACGSDASLDLPAEQSAGDDRTSPATPSGNEGDNEDSDAGAVDDTDAGAVDDTEAAGTGSGLCTACDGSCAQTVAIDSASHVSGPIDYPDPPPAGGIHGPCWADYGRYDEPALSPERWVHNLEHGAVVFLYRCEAGCTDEVAALSALVDELPRTILTPYPDMPEGFAAVAWGRRLVSSCLDLEAMRAFYAESYDRAPESVAAGAPQGCP